MQSRNYSHHFPAWKQIDKHSLLPRIHKDLQAEAGHPYLPAWRLPQREGAHPTPNPRASEVLHVCSLINIKITFTDVFLLEIHAYSLQKV